MSHEYIKFEIDKTKAKMFVYQAAQLDGDFDKAKAEEE